METSADMASIAPALVKAQAEMGGAVKSSDNPFFKSRYADLTSVWKACKEALHNNDLCVIQSPVKEDGQVGVDTLLLHSSGQWIKGRLMLGVKKDCDPQADGSAITYARRYALAAFVGVCPADDDAEAAMMRTAPRAAHQELEDFMRGIRVSLTTVKRVFQQPEAHSVQDLDEPNYILGELESRYNVIMELAKLRMGPDLLPAISSHCGRDAQGLFDFDAIELQAALETLKNSKSPSNT